MTDTDMARLIQAIQLEDVRLVQVHAETRVRAAREVTGSTEIPIEWGAEVFERREDLLFVRVIVRLQVKPKDSNEDTLPLFVHTIFELRYRLPSDASAPEEALGAFAHTSGIFHAWPYARELVANVISRMRLPPITLPLFKITEHLKVDDEADSRSDTEDVATSDDRVTEREEAADDSSAPAKQRAAQRR